MATRHLGPIEIERIFLYEENPRHEPIESEPEIIEYLCKDEQVYNLARSIADAGPNPLELLGLVEISGSGQKKTYQAWEGNRRLCAIKLLNDPDRAPPHLRKDFARLSSSSAHVPIKKITAVVFDDHDDLKFWMGIIHDGFQAGVGRIDWNADQKARHFGTSSRNRVALAMLDAAEALDLITKEEREGKLTTAQRFLNNSVVREAIGIDVSQDDVTFTRPPQDFQKLLARFISDLKEGTEVTSRKYRHQIDAYGRSLAQEKGITGERIQPRSLKTVAASKKPSGTKRKAKPKKPRKQAHIEFDKALADALETVRSKKLQSLYYSICQVHLDHTPLLTVGAWAFIESLCALAGKKPETDFTAFYSNQKLADLGFSDKGAIREALSRISRNGNSTKHHEIAAGFDGAQLSNDLETLTALLIATLNTAAPNK